MAIIETEIWKKNPDKPGTVIFDKSRVAQEVYDELVTHLKADGRYPDEYFLMDYAWKDGVLIPRDADILCNTNYGGSEGVYINISLRYEKDVYEYNKASGEGEYKKRMVTENFATGKTLGDTIEDLDKMNLVASSVMAAFYGMEREVRERYAQVESGEIKPPYPKLTPYDPESTPSTTIRNGEIKRSDLVIATGDYFHPYLVGEVTAVHKVGTTAHSSRTSTDEVIVDFMARPYSEIRKNEIDSHFSEKYRKPVSIDGDLRYTLDCLKISPEYLYRIDESDLEMLLESRENCKAFFGNVLVAQTDKTSMLMERLNKNLSDYHKSLENFDTNELIDMANRISATSNAHSYMTTHHDFSEGELEFYLRFQNPLEIVTDAVKQRDEDISDIGFMLSYVYGKRDDIVADYPLMDVKDAAVKGIENLMNYVRELDEGDVCEKGELQNCNENSQSEANTPSNKSKQITAEHPRAKSLADKLLAANEKVKLQNSDADEERPPKKRDIRE